ncbi:MAG: V-type ATP synthase subunit I, partial [Firmicutes bacterium]|nr:V-type ATP synthase subunit I [Bacillota bacterium]
LPDMAEGTFYDETAASDAKDLCKKIMDLSKQVTEAKNAAGRLETQILALEPWCITDIPLDLEGGRDFSVILGTCPAASAAIETVCQSMGETLAAEAAVIGKDKEQQYIALAVHKTDEEAALNLLKEEGFARVWFKDLKGTAKENVAALEQQLADKKKEEADLIEAIKACGDQRALLEQAIDALTLEADRQAALSGMLATEKTVYFEAWVPAREEDPVGKALEKHGCAYEFSEPADDEEPPVLLENKPFVKHFGMITELYGLPGYRTVVDPNPFVMVFFIAFFGMMLADGMYGLLMAALGVFLLTKKPKGMIKTVAVIALATGISTAVWGVLFGGYFGDLPTAFMAKLGIDFVIPPLAFNPMDDPMTALYLSFVLGFIHLFVGMGLQGYRMIKQGDVWGAIFDIGFWYLILGGAGLFLIGVQAGLYMAIVGAVGVLFTAGRAKKNFFGKITGGLGSLYGITSYLSDILSYSRLMALGLSSAVVAQVVNTMGSTMGEGVVGWIIFVLVFLIGHVFNLAIGLLGAFVHTSRLQYVEFFGKFFEGGGRAFRPLFTKTKYVNIIKEEN